jgi:CARDB protein
VLVLILLVLGVRGCVNARQERAMKDYVRDVSDLTSESNQQADDFFKLMNGPGGQTKTVDIQNSLNGFRVQSAQLVDRARDLGHPGDVSAAHDSLTQTLEFRRDALAAIADALPTALGDQNRREGTVKVTRQMQTLLASDVVYNQRFIPELAKPLREKSLLDEVRIPTSRFVPTVQWLQPTFVAQKVGGLRSGKKGSAAPGLHGTGLGTVTLGGQALTPDGSVSVKLTDQLKAEIQVANQGENTETDVNVKIGIGKGSDVINAEQPLDSIAAGETKTVTLNIEEQPPTGQNVPVTVAIDPVPGEQKTDNNRQTYTVIFTR